MSGRAAYVLLGALLANPADAAPPTLRAALVEAGFEASELAAVAGALEHRVEAMLVRRDAGVLIIVYRDLDEAAQALHAVRRDAPGARPQTAAFDLSPAATCSGNALMHAGSTGRRGNFDWVELHFDPSAACTVVFDERLRERARLWGWPVAATRGRLLFQRSEPHFAPTHPLEIGLFDPDYQLDRAIFPPGGLRPDHPTERLVDILASADGDALAFTTEGEGRPRLAYVVQGLRGGQLRWRELAGEVGPLAALLEPGRLAALFATP